MDLARTFALSMLGALGGVLDSQVMAMRTGQPVAAVAGARTHVVSTWANGRRHRHTGVAAVKRAARKARNVRANRRNHRG
jgi:hypothetical protein